MSIHARDIASTVLEAVGGKSNIVANTTCMTRLRITVVDVSLINVDALIALDSVLGCAERGVNGIEVIFGPRTIAPIFKEFTRLTGIPAGIEPVIGSRRPTSRMKVQVSGSSSKASAASSEPSSQNESSPTEKSDIEPSDTALLDQLAALLDEE